MSSSIVRSQTIAWHDIRLLKFFDTRFALFAYYCLEACQVKNTVKLLPYPGKGNTIIYLRNFFHLIHLLFTLYPTLTIYPYPSSYVGKGKVPQCTEECACDVSNVLDVCSTFFCRLHPVMLSVRLLHAAVLFCVDDKTSSLSLLFCCFRVPVIKKNVNARKSYKKWMILPKPEQFSQPAIIFHLFISIQTVLRHFAEKTFKKRIPKRRQNSDSTCRRRHICIWAYVRLCWLLSFVLLYVHTAISHFPALHQQCTPPNNSHNFTTIILAQPCHVSQLPPPLVPPFGRHRYRMAHMPTRDTNPGLGSDVIVLCYCWDLVEYDLLWMLLLKKRSAKITPNGNL